MIADPQLLVAEDEAPGSRALLDTEGEGPRSSRLARLFASFSKRKPIGDIVPVVRPDDGSKYGLFDLLCIGIGSTVGSGVFVLTGSVMPIAGPSAAISWLLAGLVCLLSAVSYMELSSHITGSGSTYGFVFHTLGELPAVIGAICLTFEYGISAAGIARSWS